MKDDAAKGCDLTLPSLGEDGGGARFWGNKSHLQRARHGVLVTLGRDIETGLGLHVFQPLEVRGRHGWQHSSAVGARASRQTDRPRLRRRRPREKN